MALADGHKKNFETLRNAFYTRRVALHEVKDKATGKLVAVVCAVNESGGGIELVPIAQMFNEDPYELLEPAEGAVGG